MVINRGMHRMGPPFRTVRTPGPPPPRIFDVILLENFFPRVRPLDEDVLQKAVMKKIEEITPNAQDQLNTLMTVLQTIFDGLISSPDTFTACQIEEARPVGAFKDGTMLQGVRVADMVVILKTLPFVKTIDLLATRVLESVRKSKELSSAYVYQFEVTEEGFDIFGPEGKVKIRLTTIGPNFSKLDESSHMPLNILENNFAAIKHSRWFEDNCQIDQIKNVIRLFTYLQMVHDGLQALTPWMVTLLANYVVMNNPKKEPNPEGGGLKKEPLSEGVAFRRMLQLISSGVFLQGSAGIPDPCDNKYKRLHYQLEPEKQDVLCLTAQSLLRILSHGGPNAILGNRRVSVSSASKWNGVIVNPLDKAYEKPPPAEPAAVGGGDEMEISPEADSSSI